MTAEFPIKTGILISVAGAVVIGTFLFVDAVPQWPEYLDFADKRAYFGLPNALDVLSNIGLLVVGAWGSVFVLSPRGRAASGDVWLPWLVFFLGALLTALGSAYFHHDPNNQTLAWDRLPMTVMFAGLFAAMIGELICPHAARVLLLPLLAVGMASVLWWVWTESAGAGDLRAYGLVQFLPGFLILLMLVLYPKPPRFLPYVAGMILFFVLAKLFEYFDQQAFDAFGGILAGHALKHLCAAAAASCLLAMLYSKTGSETND